MLEINEQDTTHVAPRYPIPGEKLTDPDYEPLTLRVPGQISIPCGMRTFGR